MGVFSRFGDVWRSNVNHLVSQAEEPEKMMAQALGDMAFQLNEARKQLVAAIADEKRFRLQWEAELKRARMWKSRAMLAVRASDDGLAREALQRKNEHEELSAQHQRHWESQKAAVDQLKVMLRGLSHKVEEAKRKRNLLLAKKRRAEAQQAMNATLSSLSESSGLATFERMERSIEKLEAEAEAAFELSDEMTGDTLAHRIGQLEASHGVDMDLLELKHEMGLLPQADWQEPRRLSSARTGAEAEMEEMEVMANGPRLRAVG